MIVGTPQRDVIVARAGNDVVRSGGPDVVCGGRGSDRLTGKKLDGGAGADRLSTVGAFYGSAMLGGSGPDTLTSKGDWDSLAGGAGTDVLLLRGDGDTSVSLNADGDQVRIREAAYVVLLFSNPGPIEVDLEAGTARLPGAATGDVITTVPPSRPYIVVYGTDGDDRINVQDNGRTLVFGRKGNDTCTEANEVIPC